MYRKKIMLPAITLLFILGMSLSACANKETPTAASEESTVSTDGDSAADSPPADVSPADSAPVDAAPVDASPQEAAPSEAASAPEQTPSDTSAQTSENAASTIEGMVSEINSNSIVVNELYTAEEGDGLIAVSGTDIFTTVNFTDSTKFIIRTVVNGGVATTDSSDAPGTAANLKLDKSVIVTGTTDSTGLCAAEIVIYNFQ